MEKKINITPPEGYIIDKENSTFEEIVFKKVEEYSKSFVKLGRIKGYFVDSGSEVRKASDHIYSVSSNRNVFPEKSQAEAVLALSQLLQLRKRWLEIYDGEKDDVDWYLIAQTDNTVGIHSGNFHSSSFPFEFPSFKLAEKFTLTFKDLLEQARMFL
jgi:hypothetical protein